MSEATSSGKVLQALLTEAFQGGAPGNACFLNPGDPGLVSLCRSLSANDASTPPGPGRQTIAAHVRHVAYHLELIMRTVNGEQNVFKTADWAEAWKHPSVDERQWNELVDLLESLSRDWIHASASVPTDNLMMLTGSFGNCAHFAYHLGAIRQIWLQVRERS